MNVIDNDIMADCFYSENLYESNIVYNNYMCRE